MGLVERKHQPRRSAKSYKKEGLTSERRRRRELDIFQEGRELDIFQEGRDGEFFSPERGTELYQPPQEVITNTYQYDDFLKKVIRDGSNTKGKNIAIIGEPGAGKTTLLEKIGKYLVEHNALPIYIPLSKLPDAKLKKYLLNSWLDEPVAPKQLHKLLETQRFWLLLDGVDEINAGASEALNRVSSIIHELPGARFVVTCRLNVWDNNPNNLLDFQNYKTQQFSNEQVESFINKWFERASTSEKGEKLWKKLNEPRRERLLDLIKNPLRLALMCQVWQLNYNEDLPSTQAELYEVFVRNHYEWKQKQKKFYTTDTQQDNLKKALGKLAQKAIDSPEIRFRIGRDFARHEMGEYLFNLALKLGWLNQVDRNQSDEPFYAFYHATFQEYFAALTIDDWSHFLSQSHKNKPIENEQYRIFEPQWRQVFLLWMGRRDISTNLKEEFINKLINFQDGCGDFYKYQAFFLAGSAIAEFKDCAKSREIVSQIVKWRFGDFNLSEKFLWRKTYWERIQADAKVAFLQTNIEKGISCLIELTRNARDEYTRREAAEALGQIDPGNQNAINALVELTCNAQVPSTSIKAAEALGQIAIGNQDAINALVELIRNARDNYTCIYAAKALGLIDPGNQDAINTLVQLTRNAGYDSTIINALEILGQIGIVNQDIIIINTLVELIRNSGHELVCSHATEVLSQIGIGNQDAINVLVDKLTHEQNKYTRIREAKVLGQIDPGNQHAINTLVELTHEQYEHTRIKAAEALGLINPGNQHAINAFVELTRNAICDVNRIKAAEALGLIDPGNQDAINTLVELTHEGDRDTRNVAAKALGLIDPGNQDAINTLVELIRKAKYEFECSDEVKTLGQIGIGNQDAINILVELTHVRGRNNRTAAAKALGLIDPGNQDAINTLVESIRNTQYRFSLQYEVETLGQIGIGNKDAINALVKLTHRRDRNGTNAARALGQIGIGNKDAINALVKLTHLRDEDARNIAAKALSQIGIGNKDAINALVKLTRALSKDTRKKAAEALVNTLTINTMPLVITPLKFYSNLYSDSCNLIWHCAKYLPYSEFYKAWHPGLFHSKMSLFLSRN